MIVAGLLALSPLAAACGDDDGGSENASGSSEEATTTTVAEAIPEVCEAVEAIDAAVDPLFELDPATATVGQVTEATAPVKASIDEAKSAAGDALETRIAALEGAYEDLGEALGAVEASSTLEDAAPAPQSALARVSNAASLLASDAGCED